MYFICYVQLLMTLLIVNDVTYYFNYLIICNKECQCYKQLLKNVEFTIPIDLIHKQLSIKCSVSISLYKLR